MRSHQTPRGRAPLRRWPRGEAKSGNKAWLRRRLHAALLRSYLDEHAGDEEASDVSGGGGGESGGERGGERGDESSGESGGESGD